MTHICKINIFEENEQYIAQKAEETNPDNWGINPRYHEETMTLEQAKQKQWAKYGPFYPI
ncbi:MAG: hypothetical protein ACFFAS_13610 [Promethearchaeota archaeon]